MAFSIPSSNDFKQQYRRDFKYSVPGFGAVIALTIAGGVITGAVPLAGGYGYAPGASVSISDTTGSGGAILAVVQGGQLISCSISAGGVGYTNPTATLFGGDNSNLRLVTDDDINGAILDATDNMNESLFGTQQVFTRAFLFLAAHLLCSNIIASTEGLASQQSWLTNSKAVDGVSQSFVIPERIREDPFLASLSTTRYGLNYLTIVMPYMVGHVMALPRETNPV